MGDDLRSKMEKLSRERPGRWTKYVNCVFLILVLGAFTIPLFWHDPTAQLISIEIGVLLLSLKLAYFLRNEARVIHFEFWTLTSIEHRVGELEKHMRRLGKAVEHIKERLQEGDRNVGGEGDNLDDGQSV